MAAYRSDRRAHCISHVLTLDCSSAASTYRVTRTNHVRNQRLPLTKEIVYLCKCFFGGLGRKSEFKLSLLYFIFNRISPCKFVSIIQRKHISRAILCPTSSWLKILTHSEQTTTVIIHSCVFVYIARYNKILTFLYILADICDPTPFFGSKNAALI